LVSMPKLSPASAVPAIFVPIYINQFVTHFHDDQ
jgi:hypothetical protein